MDIVIFSVADKEYGINIKQVRQVIRMRKVTQVPDSSDFVEGVISLRGKVIPLVNLRKKFSLPTEDIKIFNRIIITEINGSTIGILVDKVINVLSIASELISAPDEVLKDVQYLVGVAKVASRLILIVDTDKILNIDEKSTVAAVPNRVTVRKKRWMKQKKK